MPEDFHDLTLRGRTRRLRSMAEVALRQYDIDVTRLSVLSSHYNANFRVDASNGQRYVLRIRYPADRTRRQIESEIAWLTALSRDTDLCIPGPVPSRDADPVLTVQVPGVPEPRHCALFTWVEGRHAMRKPTELALERVGEVMARLHDHAEQFSPPPGFMTERLDQVWPYGRPAQLDSDEPSDLLTPERRALLRAAAVRINDALCALYAGPRPDGPLFLHADLHLANVKFHQGRTCVLDFDDSAWGFPVQDIGISLFYIQHRPNFDDLRAAFQRGYTRLRPWPFEYDGQLETFMASRLLDLVSHDLREDDPMFGDYIALCLNRSEPMLGRWLGCGW